MGKSGYSPAMLPLVHHPAYVAPLPNRHRFPMNKFAALIALLRAEGLAGEDNLHAPSPAPRWHLELVHDGDYVADMLEGTASPATLRRIGLPWSPALAFRSRCAVAGTLLTAELALQHGIACNTAGGSHHARADGGAGYCVFNDVAVAARVLQARGRAQRMLVVDLDVHQGDGTARIFAGDPAVFTFSMHAERNFPVRKAQSDLDVPLPDGMADEAYLACLADHLPALLARERPELVFYVAGVDPHGEDRLGRLALSDAGLARRDAYVLRCCREQQIPVAGVLGGGYADDMAVLARRHALLHRSAAQLLDPAEATA